MICSQFPDDDLPVGDMIHIAYTDEPPPDGRGRLVYNDGKPMYELIGIDTYHIPTGTSWTKWVYA